MWDWKPDLEEGALADWPVPLCRVGVVVLVEVEILQLGVASVRSKVDGGLNAAVE